jgi:hypothetical protein
MRRFAPSSVPVGGIPFLNVPNLANPHYQNRDDTCESLGFRTFVISVTGVSCDLLLCRPLAGNPLILLSAVIGGRMVYTTANFGLSHLLLYTFW